VTLLGFTSQEYFSASQQNGLREEEEGGFGRVASAFGLEIVHKGEGEKERKTLPILL